MAKKIASKEQKKNKIFAFLSVFLWIIGVVIALIFKRNDPYVMHYAKQSLVITIVLIIAIAGILLLPIMWIALWVTIIVLWVLAWLYALSGEERDIPILGEYARRWNI